MIICEILGIPIYRYANIICFVFDGKPVANTVAPENDDLETVKRACELSIRRMMGQKLSFSECMQITRGLKRTFPDNPNENHL